MTGNGSNDSKGIFAVLLMATLIWGASPIAIKFTLMQLTPIEVATLRFAIALPPLLLISYLWKGRDVFRIDLRDLPYFVLIATVGIVLNFFLKIWSLEYTTISNFSLIYNTSTFFIMVFSIILLHEKLSQNKVLGAAIAFIGLFVLVTNGQAEFDANLAGDTIALGAACVWGLYTVLGKRMDVKYSALTVLNWVFLIGVLELIPFYLLMPHTSPVAFTDITWLALLFQVIFSSLVAFLTYNVGLEHAPASTVAMSLYVMPLSGVLLGVAILGEHLTPFSAIGAALILYGIFEARKGVRASKKITT